MAFGGFRVLEIMGSLDGFWGGFRVLEIPRGYMAILPWRIMGLSK